MTINPEQDGIDVPPQDGGQPDFSERTDDSLTQDSKGLGIEYPKILKLLGKGILPMLEKQIGKTGQEDIITSTTPENMPRKKLGLNPAGSPNHKPHYLKTHQKFTIIDPERYKLNLGEPRKEFYGRTADPKTVALFADNPDKAELMIVVAKEVGIPFTAIYDPEVAADRYNSIAHMEGNGMAAKSYGDFASRTVGSNGGGVMLQFDLAEGQDLSLFHSLLRERESAGQQPIDPEV